MNIISEFLVLSKYLTNEFSTSFAFSSVTNESKIFGSGLDKILEGLFISFFRYSEVGIPLEYFCHNVPFP